MTPVYIARVLGVDKEEDLPREMIVTESHFKSGYSGHNAKVSIFDGDRAVEVADLSLPPGDKQEIEFRGEKYFVLHRPELEH